MNHRGGRAHEVQDIHSKSKLPVVLWQTSGFATGVFTAQREVRIGLSIMPTVSQASEESLAILGRYRWPKACAWATRSYLQYVVY